MKGLSSLIRMLLPPIRLKKGARHLQGRLKTGDHVTGEVLGMASSRFALVRIADVLVTAETRSRADVGDRIILRVESTSPRIRLSVVERRKSGQGGIKVKI